MVGTAHECLGGTRQLTHQGRLAAGDAILKLPQEPLLLKHGSRHAGDVGQGATFICWKSFSGSSNTTRNAFYVCIMDPGSDGSPTDLPMSTLVLVASETCQQWQLSAMHNMTCRIVQAPRKVPTMLPNKSCLSDGSSLQQHTGIKASNSYHASQRALYQ